MFIGHYAAAYVLKGSRETVPLWLVLLCVQFVDLLWAIFIFLGIERASYDPAASVFLRAVYEYYPYTHSLVFDVVIASLVGLVVYKLCNREWAIIAGIAVLSHWFLDVIVHSPDVPLLFDSYKVGFGLWRYPVFTLIMEVALFTAGLWFVLGHTRIQKMKWVLVGVYAFLSVFYVATFFAPPVEPTTTQLGIFGLLLYGGVPLTAYILERKGTNP